MNSVLLPATRVRVPAPAATNGAKQVRTPSTSQLRFQISRKIHKILSIFPKSVRERSALFLGSIRSMTNDSPKSFHAQQLSCRILSPISGQAEFDSTDWHFLTCGYKSLRTGYKAGAARTRKNAAFLHCIQASVKPACLVESDDVSDLKWNQISRSAIFNRTHHR
jgi:hypothetical protein